MMKRPLNSGFTLIEMIVSVGLFAIVMLVAMGAYLSLINLDRRARATNDLVTNLTFAVDTMERSLRTGSSYQCGGGTNCWPGGSNNLTFVDDQGQTITYLLKSDNTIGQCIGGGCTASNAKALTDPRVTIQSLKFYVKGVGTGDGLQPRVTFSIKGTLTPDAITGPITFTLQSTASQRAIEL